MFNRSSIIVGRTLPNLAFVAGKQLQFGCTQLHPTVQLFSTAFNPAKSTEYERSSSTVGDSNPDISKTEEQVAQYLQRHQKGISLPVRPEFMRATPLKTEDLKAIDIHVYHYKPKSISDHVAYIIVKTLRLFADAFFRKRYVHRAIVLETVAGVPGMVAGMFCHLKSLRRMQNDNGWIEKLLHEAENERMHLMIWMQVTNPTLLERTIVTMAQGVFWNLYAFFYLLFPKTAHRMVGYLEEEAVVSYNGFVKAIVEGSIENSPAPKIAIEYYNLDKNARLLDVVYAVRADEAAHRDANHEFADRIELRDENLSHELKK